MYETSQGSISSVEPANHHSIRQPFVTELDRCILAYLESTDRNAPAGKAGNYKSTLQAAAQFFHSQGNEDGPEYSKVLSLIENELRNLEYLERVKGMVLQA